MRVLLGFVLLCALLLASPANATQPVEVRVNPAVSLAPATVVLTILVEPDERNRLLTVVADSGDFYRSSEVTLEGDRASRTRRITLRNLPPGEYTIRASVTRADNSSRIAETQMVVTG
ncbi:MAG TPA: hypothetical protein VK911_03590 [Vicinamibacterales bacterium]|nr:hypothetical protein [Vicinamibacterales bacterium]